jgi:hypothetical protein
MIILLVILVLVLFSSLQIGIFFRRVHNEDHLNIRVRALFGLVRLQFEVPIIKLLQRSSPGVEVKTEIETAPNETTFHAKRKIITPSMIMNRMQKARKRLQEVYGLLDWVKQTLKYVRCDKLTWFSKIGTGDAAETGVLTGLVWGVKTTFLGVGLRMITLRTVPRVNVIPVYNHRHFHSELECILRIRVGYAILAGIRFIPRFIKGKGGEGKWQSILFRA